MRRLLDVAVRGLCRLVLSIFFREVEVVGEERIPEGVPLLLVGNHTNALVDPVLLLGFLPTRPRLLAKSTLWKNPLLAPLLALGGAIPVYRRQDIVAGKDAEKYMAQNEDMFSRCHAELAGGGTIALFPEGQSHNEPQLQPLKTGVARIALEAEQKYEGLGIRIVPVGLIFDARTRFRSRALLQVGHPIDPTPEVKAYERDPKRAVDELTERVRAALSEVTLNYSSWEEAQLADRVAELFALDVASQASGGMPLSERAALSKTFFEGYQELRRREPARVAAVYDAVKKYDRLLRVFNLKSQQIASDYPTAMVVLFVVRTVRVLVLKLPLTIVGVLLNYIPFKVPGWVAPHIADDPDEVATYKVFIGFFLFPMFWVGEALIAGWRMGFWSGVLVLILAPLSGYFALKSRDRRDRFLAEARAFFILRNNKRLAAELGRRRETILSQLGELVELWRRSQEQAATGA